MLINILIPILSALILSPSVAYLIARRMTSNHVIPLLVLQKSVIIAIKTMNEDDNFEFNSLEKGNFVNLVYQILDIKSDVMDLTEYVRHTQALLAAIRRMNIKSDYNYYEERILPLFVAATDINNEHYFGISVSALLSVCFSLINSLEEA